MPPPRHRFWQLCAWQPACGDATRSQGGGCSAVASAVQRASRGRGWGAESALDETSFISTARPEAPIPGMSCRAIQPPSFAGQAPAFARRAPKQKSSPRWGVVDSQHTCPQGAPIRGPHSVRLRPTGSDLSHGIAPFPIDCARRAAPQPCPHAPPMPVPELWRDWRDRIVFSSCNEASASETGEQGTVNRGPSDRAALHAFQQPTSAAIACEAPSRSCHQLNLRASATRKSWTIASSWTASWCSSGRLRTKQSRCSGARSACEKQPREQMRAPGRAASRTCANRLSRAGQSRYEEMSDNENPSKRGSDRLPRSRREAARKAPSVPCLRPR